MSNRRKRDEKSSGSDGDDSDRGGEGSVNAYERARVIRIRDNEQRMVQLGIRQLTEAFKKTSLGSTSKARSPASSPKKKARTPSSSPPEPTRRSSRLKELPPVNYSPQQTASKGKRKLDTEIHIEEGTQPEFYTEEQLKLLGDCANEWDGEDDKNTRKIGQEKETSCHQCRQKTPDQHTKCSKCGAGRYCGNCLYRRYGENLYEANENSNWTCPKCRDICNCSICRSKKGWNKIGSMHQQVRNMGYKSVAHYLIESKQISFTGPSQGSAMPFPSSAIAAMPTLSSADAVMPFSSSAIGAMPTLSSADAAMPFSSSAVTSMPTSSFADAARPSSSTADAAMPSSSSLDSQPDQQNEQSDDTDKLGRNSPQFDSDLGSDDVDAAIPYSSAANAAISSSSLANPAMPSSSTLDAQPDQQKKQYDDTDELGRNSPQFDSDLGSDDADAGIPYKSAANAAIPSSSSADPAMPSSSSLDAQPDQQNEQSDDTDGLRKNSPQFDSDLGSDDTDAGIPYSSKAHAAMPYSSKAHAAIPYSSKAHAAIPYSSKVDAAMPYSSKADAAMPYSSADAAMPSSSSLDALPDQLNVQSDDTDEPGRNSPQFDSDLGSDDADAEIPYKSAADAAIPSSSSADPAMPSLSSLDAQPDQQNEQSGDSDELGRNSPQFDSDLGSDDTDDLYRDSPNFDSHLGSE